MKPVMRTTVILDEDLRKKLRMLSLKRDVSMRDIITQALEDKIKRELDQEDVYERPGTNKLVTKLIAELEPFIGLAPAQALIAQKCKKFGISMKELSQPSITKEFISAICQGVAFVSNAEDAAYVKKKLTSLVKEK
jgi:hypothetical protein